MESGSVGNSGLGNAITYFELYWKALTLFPCVSLVRHWTTTCPRGRRRKPCCTARMRCFIGHGAGDCLTTLVNTCELNQVNAFRYLVEFQRLAADRPYHRSSGCPGATVRRRRPPGILDVRQNDCGCLRCDLIRCSGRRSSTGG